MALRDFLQERKKNLQAWGQVLTQPKPRQDYVRLVARPAVRQLQQRITQPRQMITPVPERRPLPKQPSRLRIRMQETAQGVRDLPKVGGELIKIVKDQVAKEASLSARRRQEGVIMSPVLTSLATPIVEAREKISPKIEKLPLHPITIGWKVANKVLEFLSPSEEERRLAKKYYTNQPMSNEEVKALNRSNLINIIGLSLDVAGGKMVKAAGKKIKPSLKQLQEAEEAILKEAAKELEQVKKAGTYSKEISKFRNFLRVAGEKKSKETKMLFREHIPRSVFGVSSDEIASALGKSENEFMEELTKDLDIIEQGKSNARVLAKVKTKITKLKTFAETLKLDKDIFATIDNIDNELATIPSYKNLKPYYPPGAVSAKATKQTQKKIAADYSKAKELTAKQDYQEWQRQLFKQEGAEKFTPHRAATKIAAGIKQTPSTLSRNVEELKDTGNIRAFGADFERVFRKAYGERYRDVRRILIDPYDKAKGEMVNDIEKWTEMLKTNIVNRFGFGKGSKESAAIQNYGEKLSSYDDLVEQFGEIKANQIVEADTWFRQVYNQLLDEVNGVLKRIYPNNPEKLIHYRNDYYRHFRELTGFQGLRNIFENPAGIDPSLVGVSDFTKPKSRWLSIAQRRLGLSTDQDAVGGFIDYIQQAAYAKHINPHIRNFRALRDELVSATEDAGKPASYKKLNNFIEWLNDYANDLAGKTNPIDRPLQKYVPGGRKTFIALNWLNRRVKMNVILANAAASIAQIFNVPQGIASAGVKNSLAGGVDMVLSLFKKVNPMDQSTFLRERYVRKYIRQFDTKLLQQPQRFAEWMMGVLDEAGSKFIWNAHYKKAVSEEIAAATRYADIMTRRMVAGRGVGEVPLGQKAKVFQLVAPFQLEVGNLWWVMKDWVDEKQFDKIAKLLIYNWVFNSAVEPIIGRRITYDPIDALVDELGDDEVSPIGIVGRQTGELLSNIPVGQTVAAQLPEELRQRFFAEADPTRFGAGLMIAKGITDPLYKILPPFGGGQLKKTLEGLETTAKGYSESRTGKVRTPVGQSPEKFIQAFLFGEYALPEMRQYFDEDRKVLGEKQSEKFKQMSPEQRQQFYNKIMRDREIKAMQQKVKEGAMTPEEYYKKVGGIVTDTMQKTTIGKPAESKPTIRIKKGRKPSVTAPATRKLVVRTPRRRVRIKPKSLFTKGGEKYIPKSRIRITL